MADKKISQLTALSAANLAPSTDVLAIVDTSATETKKIVAQDLINGVLNVASAVGIGTASPGFKLDVQGSATDFVAFNGLNTNNNAGTITSSAIKFGFTSTVGTHYATLKITEDSVNSNSGGLTISLPNGGVETPLLALTSAGNLGIGTTSPVSGGLTIGNDGNSSGTPKLAFSTGLTERASLQMGGGSGEMRMTAGYAGYGGFATFYTNGSERARITAGGYFKASNDGTYVDSTGAYHELRVTNAVRNTYFTSSGADPYGPFINYSGAAPNGTGNEFLYCTDNASGGTIRATIRSNGGLANYSANNVNLASDERLKKDISPLDSAWSKVKGMEVVNFRYKDCNEGDPLLYGVIAQQVQPIVPELVVVTREAREAKEAELDDEGNVVKAAVESAPEYYGIREQPMYWLAIKALQEAMAKIETLEAKVAALESA